MCLNENMHLSYTFPREDIKLFDFLQVCQILEDTFKTGILVRVAKCDYSLLTFVLVAPPVFITVMSWRNKSKLSFSDTDYK